VLAGLVDTPADDLPRLGELAAAARAALLAAPMPEPVAAEVEVAYRALGQQQGPVAVRSSATAEDLPDASFAGQHDTFLNVIGTEAVLEAVRRCWASLWTDRAVAYRARNAMDHRGVLLAVVVQRMVAPSVAGVLFTANPLTGRRRQTVIEASPGLGERIVSGAVTPDHFVVAMPGAEIVERRHGDNDHTRPGFCLSDEQLQELAALGARIEAHFGTPQDIEWAIGPLAEANGEAAKDDSARIWLLQARPITTLFPLPAKAAQSDDDLRVYSSVNVAQGVFRPLTPMGLQAFRLMGSSIAGLLGRPPSDPLAGPGIMMEAAGRLFLDLTAALRSEIGRSALLRLLPEAEARTATILQQLVDDPRLSIRPVSRLPLLRALLLLLARTRLPLRIALALLFPAAARARAWRQAARLDGLAVLPADTDSLGRLSAVQRLFLEGMPRVAANFMPLLVSGLSAYAWARSLLRGLATADELQTVLRGLPHNPTTEMDLAIWALAQRLRGDAAARAALLEASPRGLAADYRRGVLPTMLQRGLEDFLRAYGHRAVAEIDLGLPRWADDPTYVLGVLANYLRLEDASMAPDGQFRRGALEAEAMVAELGRRAARESRWRGLRVGFCLSRTRALAGLREAPKFNVVKLMARARQLLLPVGDELVFAGRLEAADDIFFLGLAEARSALAGVDMRSLVADRRAAYQREIRRPRVPRILLSDGTEPSTGLPSSVDDGRLLRGAPASAGLVTGPARVILDPIGARLDPGEILVVPSTDPGWTPLFLTAGGLVMEMGGAMSHGAVVAREYGIPAVVAVPGATERIQSGQPITVDGSAGTVAVEEWEAGSGKREGFPLPTPPSH
jgi:pyruvate,water dikinase